MPIEFSLARRQLLAFAGLGINARVFALGPDEQGSLPRFISASANAEGEFFVQGFELTEQGAESWFQHALPGRAHHVAVPVAAPLATHQESGIYIVMARRPGNWMVVGDLKSGELLQTIELPENRHFYGHGIFSADGQQFFTVENDLDNPEGDSGLVGVWNLDVLNKQPMLSRVGEFSTHGVGPHELVLMPDQQTLAVANGGIRTGSDSGREKLNTETMKPSLSYLDSKNGVLLEQVFLPDEFHQCSIRHLDVNKNGQVAVAMQFEGPAFMDVPLVAFHKQGLAFELPDIPLHEQQQMKQYCGSVRFDESGQYLAVSCPRGNRITFWNVASGNFVNSVRSRDGCGVCAFEDGFIFTAGSGRVSHFSFKDQQVLQLSNDGLNKVFWDNHLSMLV